MLAVMSGQGGIAVLVSSAQVILAIISALHSTSNNGEGIPSQQSNLAGVGLWALGAIGTLGCMVAHRRLMLHPDYHVVLEPITNRSIAAGDRDTMKDPDSNGMTARILKKNVLLNMAVGWVFVVTLVSEMIEFYLL